MYKRESGGWLKHYDFLLLDMICLQIAFLLSFVVLGRGFNPYSHILYRKMALYLELADVVVVFFFDSFSGVLKKGYYRNFVSFPVKGRTAVFQVVTGDYFYIVYFYYICCQRIAQA